MKIGAFAKTTGVSIMTIRFYMDEGLLLPRKAGSLWDFTDSDISDMAAIQEMRGCGFSIKTIRAILDFSRHGNGAPSLKASIIKGEYDRICRERDDLDRAIGALKSAIAAIQPPPEAMAPVSIPFSLFSLIACPYCGTSLNWDSVAIRENAVQSGHGRCGCGFTADIQEGILLAHTGEKPLIRIVDTDRQTLKKRRAQDVSFIEKYYVWLLEQLKNRDMSGQVIFEDVINTICFCSRAVTELSGSPAFILCDTDINVVRYYAKNMLLLKPDCQLLMMVDDGVHHPLKHSCIDVVLDYCSTEIHQSYGYPSLCSIIAPYVKRGAFMLGRFSRMTKRKLPLSLTKSGYSHGDEIRYSFDVFLKDMQEHGVTLLSEIHGTERLDESIYNGCAPGDEMHPYVFTARWGGRPGSL